MDYDHFLHTQLIPDPSNARKHYKEGAMEDLCDSIAEYGLLENLIVRRGNSPGSYFIVGGERRYTAIGRLIAAGKWPANKPIVCLVIDSDGTIENLVENLCREEVDLWDQGARFNELCEFGGITQNDLAARIGKSQGYVSRLCSIARGLHPSAVERLRKGHTHWTSGELSRISSLTNADREPDGPAQIVMIEHISGIRGTRKRKRRMRSDPEKIARRLNHLKDRALIPRHALPYVNAIVSYLSGESTRIRFPTEDELL